MKIVHVKIEDELHRRFKMLCAERSSNMTAEINWLMTRELESVAKATKKRQPGVTGGIFEAPFDGTKAVKKIKREVTKASKKR
jgi:hypothetical protein